MGAVKGSAWLTFTEFLVQKSGPGAIEKVLKSLPPDDAKYFSQKILPITWVDYAYYTRFLLQADKVCGRGDYELIRESAVFHANKDMNGLYRMFIRIATPGFVLGKSAQLWRLMMDQGKLVVSAETPKSAELRLTEFPNIPLHHELDQLPFMEEIARMTGAKNVKSSHPKCLARGDDHCIYSITWE